VGVLLFLLVLVTFYTEERGQTWRDWLISGLTIVLSYRVMLPKAKQCSRRLPTFSAGSGGIANPDT